MLAGSPQILKEYSRIACSVDEDDPIANLAEEEVVEEEVVEEEAAQTTAHPARPGHDQHILPCPPFEPFTQEAAFPSFSRKTSNQVTRSEASSQNC